jgi:tripartite-type tricarboxylate transporter receptor subunit TctC
MKLDILGAGLLLGIIGWSVGFVPASGQSAYPNRAVTMVVPFPAGGRTDIIGRIVGQELARNLGKPVAIINKPGASSVLGSREVAESAADGYTLGFFC